MELPDVERSEHIRFLTRGRSRSRARPGAPGRARGARGGTPGHWTERKRSSSRPGSDRPQGPWYKQTWAIVVGAVLALFFLLVVVAALVPTEDTSDDSEKASAPLKPISLNVSTKGFSAVKGPVATLTGTVAPRDASVQVEGVSARVDRGRWTARVRLRGLGENEIKISARAPGYRASSANTVLVRRRTKAEVAAQRARSARRKRAAARLRQQRASAARQRKADRERREREEAAPAPPAGGGSITVPNEVGENHQAAQNAMQAEGLYLLVEKDCTGQGRLLLYDRNWVVVSQEPAAGSQASEDDTVTLCSKEIGE